MASWLIITLVAVGVVAFFVLALSLTLIFKGHNLESEVGENRHMKQKGLKCATQEIKEEEAALRGCSVDALPGCSDTDCGTCSSSDAHHKTDDKTK